MPIRTLFDQGPESYVREAFGQLGKPWCFIHIPKTAGTSFKTEVLRLFKYRNLYLLPADYEQVASGHLSFTEALGAKLSASLEELRQGKLNFVSGHLHYHAIAEIAAGLPGLRLMTFLRHPADRLISDYRYCLSPAFPNHVAFAAKHPTISSYLKETGEMDKTFRYLCAVYEEDPAQTASRMENTFAFVGLVEQYEYYRQLFWRINAIQPPEALQENVTENASLSRSQLGSFREEIAAANPRDMVIYNHFAKRAEALAIPGA